MEAKEPNLTKSDKHLIEWVFDKAEVFLRKSIYLENEMYRDAISEPNENDPPTGPTPKDFPIVTREEKDNAYKNHLDYYNNQIEKVANLKAKLMNL